MEHTNKTRPLCAPKCTLLSELPETTLEKPSAFLDPLAFAPPKGLSRGHPPVKEGLRGWIR